MNRLAQLQADLQDVSNAVARAERTLAANPDVPSVAATLKTITRRQQNLQDEFPKEAAKAGREDLMLQAQEKSRRPRGRWLSI